MRDPFISATLSNDSSDSDDDTGNIFEEKDEQWTLVQLIRLEHHLMMTKSFKIRIS